MKPNNLIILMADQLRFDVLGKGFTPHIDSLAKESVVFDRTYTQCPLCVPARGAFFTGLCPNANGSLINPWEKRDARYGDVRKGIDNLYLMVERAGWCSIHTGKQHLYTQGGKLEDRAESPTFFASTEKSYKEFLKANDRRMPGGPRFRTYVPEMVGGKTTKIARYSTPETGRYEEGEPYYFDSYFTKTGIEALRKRNKTKPLFLSVMFLAPHPPLDVPDPWYSRVRNEDFSLPENVGKFYPGQSVLQMYNLPGIVGSHYRRSEWQETWRVYLGLVSMLDKLVGDVIDELRRQDAYDDSIIVFTSDHGEMLGSHALFQKMCMYEESVHVPLSIKFPKAMHQKHQHIHQVVSHIDVLPTLVELTGLHHEGPLEGASLMSTIKSGDKDEKRTSYIQYDGNGSRSNFQRAIVHGSYKLIVDMFKDELFYELYDVVKDPEETTNLIFNKDYDEVARSLFDDLADHMRKSGDLLAVPGWNLMKFRSDREDLLVP